MRFNVFKITLIAFLNFCCQENDYPPFLPCLQEIYIDSKKYGICDVRGDGPACKSFKFGQEIIHSDCSSKEVSILPGGTGLCHLEITLAQGQIFYDDIDVYYNVTNKCPQQVSRNSIEIDEPDGE